MVILIIVIVDMWPEATDFRLSENSAVVCPTSPSTKKSEVLTTLEKKKPWKPLWEKERMLETALSAFL